MPQTWLLVIANKFRSSRRRPPTWLSNISERKISFRNKIYVLRFLFEEKGPTYFSGPFWPHVFDMWIFLWCAAFSNIGVHRCASPFWSTHGSLPSTSAATRRVLKWLISKFKKKLKRKSFNGKFEGFKKHHKCWNSDFFLAI